MFQNIITRIPLKYRKKVILPKNLKMLLWDHPDQPVMLEKIITRVLKYGRFEEIKWLYDTYPRQTYDVTNRYSDIKRGVKFWINHWNKND